MSKDRDVGFDEYMALSHGVMQHVEVALTEEEKIEAQEIATQVADEIMKKGFEKDLNWQVLVYGGVAGMTAIMQAVSELLEGEE